jgi:succinoglycan biosynthesis protein ExoV
MRLVHFKGRLPNFGDDINQTIWPALAPELFGDEDEDGFLGIGTIIGMRTDCAHLHVFTSGLGYDPIDTWTTPRTFWCVRGPMTARLLGCPPETALTDGAILAPLVMSERRPERPAGGIGVIPHWESLLFPGWQEACRQAGMTLISPMDTPEAVLRAVLSVDLILAESLHGAIIADTYDIPWVPFVSSGNFSLFKWKDWAMSVDVPLSPVIVPPPSAAALLRLGRPVSTKWGQRLACDEDTAMAEFARRVRPSHQAAAPAGLRHWLKTSPLASKPIGGMLGLNPGRTAQFLTAAAREEAVLSARTRRDRLTAQMLERLQRLRQPSRARARV